MRETVRRRARELGFDGCRFTTADRPDHAGRFLEWVAAGHHGTMGYLERQAARRIDPRQVLPGAKTIILLAISYAAPKGGTPGGEAPGPIARYARYADYHEVLSVPLQALTEVVDRLGGPGTSSRWYVDTGPILERDLAHRAGLGFIGKHTNLISRSLGNWFFIAEILTTLELEPDPSERSRCGTCTRCLEACPTGAITAPYELDARRCIAYLTIEFKGSIPETLRPAIGRRIFGCDDCLEVCPWNRFAREGRILLEHRREDLQEPDLLELLALDESTFRRRFSGTPLLRSKRRGLLRNVCVALGNTGGAASVPALDRASRDSEPLVAEHAQWALSEIDRRSATV